MQPAHTTGTRYLTCLPMRFIAVMCMLSWAEALVNTTDLKTVRNSDYYYIRTRVLNFWKTANVGVSIHSCAGLNKNVLQVLRGFGIHVLMQLVRRDPGVIRVQLGLQLNVSLDELGAVEEHLGSELLALGLQGLGVRILHVARRSVTDEPASDGAHCAVYDALGGLDRSGNINKQTDRHV